MLSYRSKLRRLLLSALAFLCLHGVCVAVFKAQAAVATYPFIILAPLLALSAGCWRARRADSRMRLSWMLFSAGLLLWSAGMMLSAWEELLQHISATIAFFSDFVFFLYGVPVLLAISLPSEEQRIPLFVWLDGAQALLTAYLTYIALFAVVPFTTRSIHPIPESLLLLVYNVENLVLAGAATLRVLARPEPGEEQRFFRTLCAFLWIYAICAGVYNYQATLTSAHMVLDVLVDIPFLYLAVAALLPSTEKDAAAPTAAKTPVTLFIENASPIFYTLALLALGMAVIRSHFYVGITAIVVVLGVYGIRTTILQNRYLRSQKELREARDRLEEMSLKDALTNVANRRCFDLVIEQEWNRAIRSQSPLSLLLIDVDYFKSLNDMHGHRYGDRCLVMISAALQSVLPRSNDLLARYGGEEFAVILPGTEMSGASSVADRMRDAVRCLQIQNQTTIGDFTTVSIGIAVYEFPQAGSVADLVEASDRALYEAKQKGRNRIEFSPMHAASHAEIVL
jgi:diguanylate cyclase (GGDEF)-like protein